MKIQIDGISTVNKGAELMLSSILLEIERKHPDATIYLNTHQELKQELLPKTQNPKKVRWGLKYSRYGIAFLRRLGLPFTYFTQYYPVRGLDLVLDASGFQYSDQWIYSEQRLKEIEDYYAKLKRYKSQIVFLPQAFGPFETEYAKQSVNPIKKYIDIIIAREKISYDYLIELGFPENKLRIYPDFTLKTKGTIPLNFEHLKGSICIIPNLKMISHGDIDSDTYLDFLIQSIHFFESEGFKVFLLNHEGPGDHKLCISINKKLQNTLEIVSDMKATELKGLISQSFLVVSSRYHGVASSLSSGIPCLSTSWNHKYKMLYLDFEVESQVIDTEENWKKNKLRIQNFLANRTSYKNQLISVKPKLVDKNEKMWEDVWSQQNNIL